MTWTWIVIALAFAAGLVAYSARKKKNPANDPDSTQATAQGTEQIADADTDSEDRASSSVLQPPPDTQTGHTDPARHLAAASLSAALGGDPGRGGQPRGQLLEAREMEPILGQWKDIQAEFVDEPRKAVQDADALVAELMQRLAQTFATEREQLESHWAGGDDVSTEDLRRSLRRYRSFVEQPYAQLLETPEMEPILGQWKDIQAEFVDEPRKAVQDADALVAELMQRLAQTFATEREQLESHWAGGDDVSTEDLRRSLRRYRSFVEQPYAQLLETPEMEPILGQWKDIQAEFVDEPRKAVQDADALAAQLMQRLAQTFATEREQLESESAGGDDVSTEDLRRSLRRYRSFFERLLAA